MPTVSESTRHTAGKLCPESPVCLHVPTHVAVLTAAGSCPKVGMPPAAPSEATRVRSLKKPCYESCRRDRSRVCMPGRWPVFASESCHPPKSRPICGLRGVWTHTAHIGRCVMCLDPRVQVEDGCHSGRRRGWWKPPTPASPLLSSGMVASSQHTRVLTRNNGRKLSASRHVRLYLLF